MTLDDFNNRMKIVSFLRKYPDIFTQRETEHILAYTGFVGDEKEDNKVLVPDDVREVYDELGIIPDDRNIYIGFMNLLSNTHDIKNRNILEVGGGVLPRLGKRIAANLDHGKIVVYDPRLSHYEESSNKLRLVKKRFYDDTDIEDTDLMIGLMPCEAANVIVRSAIEHGVDFMLALCEGGPHGDEFDYYEDESEWRASIMYDAATGVREKGMGELKTVYMKEYGSPYPVIYNSRG